MVILYPIQIHGLFQIYYEKILHCIILYYLVTFRQHGVQVVITEWSVSLVYLSLPSPSLHLFQCHTHHMSWGRGSHSHSLCSSRCGATGSKSSRCHSSRSETAWSHSSWSHTRSSSTATAGCTSSGGHARSGATSWCSSWCLIPARSSFAGTGSGSLLNEVTTSTVCFGGLSPSTTVTWGICKKKNYSRITVYTRI